MKYVDDLPHPIHEVETVWITMSDGCRLAARLWLPEDAEQRPVPAVLEYIPYRRRDRTRSKDDMMHRYVAGHGYACLRVDMRGSGDSQGVLHDEYLEQELRDGEEIIAWIADQPWCDGSVGMIGISWGGFNGLQIAQRQPPGLKAIITACSTDDRYADDVHYMGGCLLGDNLSWASTMFARNTLPPDPLVVGEQWRQMWRERLEGSGLWLEKWLRHQRREAYWKHGSVCEDFSCVTIPVMAVSGWADGYTNAVFRLIGALDERSRALVGPWSHLYPHIGQPGPAIGFLQEAVRWWDQWLKGIDRGVVEDPSLRVWMQDSVPPSTRYSERPGRWVAEDSWPSLNVVPAIYRLAPGRILGPEEEPLTQAPVTTQSPLRLGLFAGKWCSYAAAPDLPGDQREEDGGALVFDSPPLAEPLEILGPPVVELELASDEPVAMIAARLTDIAPDHKASRVTYGLLNLTHRESHENPTPLEPGQRYRIRLQLNDVAHSFPAGHRIRLALSTSYWPLAWNPPKLAMLRVWPSTSTFTLPVRPPRESDAELRSLGLPEAATPGPRAMIEPPDNQWRVIRDLASDISTLEVIKDEGTWRIEDIDLVMSSRAVERYTIHDDDPDSTRGETIWTMELRRRGWHISTRTRTVLTSDAESFRIWAELDAYEGDRRVFSRNWDLAIPRDLV